jgi:hypothetical protein
MELTKNEYAAIKRIATTVKTLNSKKATLQAKINIMLADIKRIDNEINNWELPVKNMTGGFTSDQVLDGTWRLAPKNENVECYLEEDIINY